MPLALLNALPFAIALLWLLPALWPGRALSPHWQLGESVALAGGLLLLALLYQPTPAPWFAAAWLMQALIQLLGWMVRVAVFAQGANAEAAKAAGAEVVGFDDLAEQVKAGNLDFDVVIASPDAMRVVGQLGQILGPRGLMPNPKVGTVTPNVAEAVKNAKAGQVQYRTDKAGIIHATIGRASFEADALRENFVALVDALVKAKPAASKGVYLKKIAVSSTMGIGARVDTSSISA